MNRQDLINEVKAEYARLADLEGREHHHDTRWNSITPEAYYEKLLSQVISDIEGGQFDGYSSGLSIVEAVANRQSHI